MPWLQIKLALVAALVLLQFGLAHALRRMETAAPAWSPPAVLRFAAPLTFCTGLVIGVLALTKPVW